MQGLIDWLFGTYEGVAVLVGGVFVIAAWVMWGSGGGGRHRG